MRPQHPESRVSVMANEWAKGQREGEAGGLLGPHGLGAPVLPAAATASDHTRTRLFQHACTCTYTVTYVNTGKQPRTDPQACKQHTHTQTRAHLCICKSTRSRRHTTSLAAPPSDTGWQPGRVRCQGCQWLRRAAAEHTRLLCRWAWLTLRSPLPAGGGRRHSTGHPIPGTKGPFRPHVTASVMLRQLQRRGGCPPGADGAQGRERQQWTSGLWGLWWQPATCHGHRRPLGPQCVRGRHHIPWAYPQARGDTELSGTQTGSCPQHGPEYLLLPDRGVSSGPPAHPTPSAKVSGWGLARLRALLWAALPGGL